MTAEIITTLYLNGEASQNTVRQAFAPDPEVENEVVNIHPSVRCQTFRGFGATFTEAAGYCLEKAGPEVAAQVIDGYYGKDGLCYTQGRVHLDSCDASLSNYSAVEDAADTELNSFSLARDEQYLLPFIRMAQKAAGQPLELMVSPWSPPAFMKTNGQKNGGGKLKPEYNALWAKYICRFITEYQKRGVDFKMLSLQNEPKAVQIWDSCVWDASEEREYLRRHLVPELRRCGLDAIEVFIWDHNKERALERAQAILCDDEMLGIVAGTAVHWYSGDHFEELEMLRRLYPEKRVIFSEGCVEYKIYERGNYLRSAQMYAHEIIGDLNAGADAFIHWSLVFDPSGGPNHVNNLCEPVVFCDWENHSFTRLLPYYYIGHFSRHIHPGAVRICSSRYTEKLEVTAFQNPDGQRVAVVLNKTAEPVPFVLREGDAAALRHTIPGDAIATILYQ